MKVRASSRAGSLPQGERISTVGASLLAKGPSATPQNLDPQPRMLGSPANPTLCEGTLQC
ncbi:hypothetical protein DMX03_11135 [Pseudomonas koreensis]|nr:hypothetical protein DMX03_11135 [Pseudomonas koreensis]